MYIIYLFIGNAYKINQHSYIYGHHIQLDRFLDTFSHGLWIVLESITSNDLDTLRVILFTVYWVYVKFATHALTTSSSVGSTSLQEGGWCEGGRYFDDPFHVSNLLFLRPMLSRIFDIFLALHFCNLMLNFWLGWRWQALLPHHCAYPCAHPCAHNWLF